MLFYKVLTIYLLVFVKSSNCEFYSSISLLSELHELEKFYVDSFEEFMLGQKQKFNELKQVFVVLDEAARVQTGPTYYDNPLGAFKLLKRLVRHWQLFQAMAINPTRRDLYLKNVKEGIEGEPVEIMDLQGAAKGIARLQYTYELNVEDIANGILQERDINATMNAADCFQLGYHLYNTSDYERALPWLMEARRKLFNENEQQRAEYFDTVTDQLILKHLLPLLYSRRNFHLVQHLVEQQLSYDPADAEALEIAVANKNYIDYERLMILDEDDDEDEDEPNEKEEKAEKETPNALKMHQETCNGKLQQSPRTKRPLRCRYVDNGVPFCRLAKFKVEELNLDPYVAYYHDAIYESEIKNILNASIEHIERSQVGSATRIVSDIRTSQNTWLYFSNHSFLNALSQRLEDITGLTMKSAEELQVANYGIGGHYGPHHDFIDDPNYDYHGMGNRILTALFYINKVEMGGATAFPYLHLAAPPVYRSLVLWYNMHESGDFDYRTLHAGCPVIKGSKWICNEWFHAIGQDFHRPCGLQSDGHKSHAYRYIRYY